MIRTPPWGSIGMMENKMKTIILGLYWDNGKENGDCCIEVLLGLHGDNWKYNKNHHLL